ncbi:hypothetical protein [Enterovibrio calviensis]|uniref:hypothetical protein n=1 Tax=Enterovibrio calviensis TaxID=91359 RepID=UPI000482688E|nr:hypothetical protein [Enterovibrio calviensis]
MAGIEDISISNYMSIKIDAVEITDIESFSGLSEETNFIEVKQYNRSAPRKLVGSKASSTVEVTCSLNPASASYTALMAAKQGAGSKPFEVTYFQDANKTAGNSVTRTFTGLVGSYSESAEYDAQRTCTWVISIDSDIAFENGSTVKAKA